MSSPITQNPTPQNVNSLLLKLSDADPDIRYMSLNDLYATLSAGHQTFLLNDLNTCSKTVDGLLKTLDDQNGEVQNSAIKCLGPLVLKANPDILAPLIEKLSNLTTKNAIDSSISATALRTVVVSLPRSVPGLPRSKAVQDAYSAVSKVLIPRLVGYVVLPQGKPQPATMRGMLVSDPQKGVDSDAIDVLVEVVRCFGSMLQDPEIRALQMTVMDILENDRTGSVVKKKAVTAISILTIYLNDRLLSAFVSQLIESFRNPHISLVKRRLFITMIGSLTRSIPRRFGPYLKTLAPFVLSAVSEKELNDEIEETEESGESDPQLEEVREAALVTLEALLASCSSEMRAYTEEVINAAIRYLKYDPNITSAEGDEEMGDTQAEQNDGDTESDGVPDEEEDFEEEAGFSDDDDMSWKVRRCAAKLLYTLISTRGSGDLLDDGTLYEQVGPVLVARFTEREENVRLEILATMDFLVRKTGEGTVIPSASTVDESYALSLMNPPQSRKRRRGGSDASMFDNQASMSLSAGVVSPVAPPIPASGPRASLAKLTAPIVRGIANLFRGSSNPTKLAGIALLKDIVAVQHGGLSEYLNQIIDPVLEAVKASAVSSSQNSASAVSGTVSATGSNLRIEALVLVSSLAENHPSSVLQPYLSKLVPVLVSAVRDRFYKVSGEALYAVEQLVKVITPPRLSTAEQLHQAHMAKLYDVIINRTTANDADLEVRQRAIHALGVLLARTSGPEGSKLISSSKRQSALDALNDRLKNEITRLAAVRAIDTVAALASDRKDFSAAWVREVAMELGAQLRKSDRSLRGASLAAMKNLVVNPAGRANLDDKTIRDIVNVLLPLLDTNDLHLLGPALVVMANLVQGNASKVVDSSLESAICQIVLVPLGGAVLDALLILVRSIGEQGAGKNLMQGLLKHVGVNGDPACVGKVIGTLLVYGQATVGVKIEDFASELQTAQDDQRKCLALSVLGESSLRFGTTSPLQPELFISHFTSKSDQVPLTAAIALGRAAAGNVGRFLPVILANVERSGSSQYLLLHSIKEMLQHARHATKDLAPLSGQIWSKLLVTSQAEDNRAVGAECIGRLTIIDPKTYLPMLQAYLNDKNARVRGMVIQSIRYTLADTDESFDDYLRPILTSVLTCILNDSDLENRRLALTTLNSATHNKPDLILPELGHLIPLVMKESNIKSELLREVQMGPFKHKVDDGLEIRKSAYETLHSLMETAFSRINIVEFYDRVIAGLEDEHDIRVLCNLMLTKLIVLDPEETVRRLDPVAEKFRATLSFKPKENAVKQEVEKAQEASKGVLRVTVVLSESFPTAAGPTMGGMNQTWRSYLEWVKKEYGAQLKAIEEEDREQTSRVEQG
ncbi:MAG: hypothetical protein M1835_001768 [Candelina submexicana]|nr:MAG: hypothetical protein M1835_001768 [Candelina submexicana]